MNAAEKSFDDKLFKAFLLFVIVVLCMSILSIVAFANAQTDGSSETKTFSDTILSIPDPGIGHQTHQMAMILPLAEGIWYSGTLTFEASEPIQIYELIGPLGDDEFTGQPVWTPDGITMYGLNLVDLEESSGTWNFSVNALALHTSYITPFTVLYSIELSEQQPDAVAPIENINATEDVEVMEDVEDIEVLEETDDAEETEDIEEKKIIPSPRQQMKSGISPNDVVCKDGLGLIFKASNNQPSCVLPSTAIVLVERGWADAETI